MSAVASSHAARRVGFWRWIAVAVVLVPALIVVCIEWVDRPVALLAAKAHLYDGLLSDSSLSSPVLVALAVAGVAAAAFVIARPELPPWARLFAETALLAGLAMAWGLCLTEFLLKPFFGRLLPFSYLDTGDYGFHWFRSTPADGSFPSGHMVQICSVASVFWAAYPRLRTLCVLASIVVAVALVLAERHFLSDILGGAEVGVASGVLLLHVWNAHRRLPR